MDVSHIDAVADGVVADGVANGVADGVADGVALAFSKPNEKGRKSLLELVCFLFKVNLWKDIQWIFLLFGL